MPRVRTASLCEPSAHPFTPRALTGCARVCARSVGGTLLFDGAWANEWLDWRDSLFVELCILSGTDYMPGGVPGLGPKTAHALLRTHRNSGDEAAETVEESLAAHLDLPASGRAPVEVLEHFERVRSTFAHQRVYDPTTRSVVMLTPLAIDDAAHLGLPMDDDFADAICIQASIDPITLEDTDDFAPHLPPPSPLPPSPAAAARAASSSDPVPPTNHPTSPPADTAAGPAAGPAAAEPGDAELATCAWGGTVPSELPAVVPAVAEDSDDRPPAAAAEGSTGGQQQRQTRISRFFAPRECNEPRDELPVPVSRAEHTPPSPRSAPEVGIQPSNSDTIRLGLDVGLDWVDLRSRDAHHAGPAAARAAPPARRRMGVDLSRAPTTSDSFLERFRV